MSEAKLTHCPHCHATFKVHDQQLNVAQGKVRCGSCLKVFNALEHLVDNQDYIPVAREQYKPEEELRPTPTKTAIENKVAILKSTTSAKPAPSAPKTNRSNDTENELLFQDDPNEDNEEESYSGKGSFTGELSTTFLNIDTNDDKPTHGFANAIEDEATESFGSNDESWALKMLEDDEPKEDPSKTASNATNTHHQKNTQSPSSSQVDDLDFSDEFSDLDSDLSSSTPLRADKTTHFSANEEADPVTGEAEPSPFDEIYSEPASSQHYEQRERGFLGTLIWGLVNLILLVVMVGQLAWFHYDKLIQYKPAKMVFTRVCVLLKCELPELIDTNLIKSRNLIVRSHPTLPKALIIDAIITNQASFNQPFPDMALYFSNLNNEIVAQRLFRPNEYLAGDVASWEEFPTNTPIHISLEIYDPGANAVNYKVMFYRHTEPTTPKTVKK